MDRFRKKVLNFMDKHPKACRRMDMLFDATDKFMFIYSIIIVVLLVLFPAIVFYFMLNAEIRKEISPIIGAAFSVVIIPLVINRINIKDKNRERMCELNKNLYENLIELIIQLLKKDTYNKSDTEQVQHFLDKHYGRMCVSLSTSSISEVYSILRGCKNNNKENVKYYSEKIIKKIRKQYGLKREFCISQNIIDEIK